MCIPPFITNFVGETAVVGDAKLELTFNDLNPNCPVLVVKLQDILFQSSKSVSSGRAFAPFVG